MPLHINEIGIRIDVGQRVEDEEDKKAPADFCEDDDSAKKQEERLVSQAVRKVLQILKDRETR